jgi:hypothetical protein
MSRINALSTKAGLVPEAAELILGQFAINAADGRIYIESVSGLIICVGADISQFATAEDIESIDLTPYALQATVTQALTGVAQQLATLSQALSAKAASIHGHAIADVAELGTTLSTMQQGINGKQPTGNYAAAAHNHPITQVDGLQTAIDGIIASLQGKQPVGNYQPAGDYAAAAHIHSFSQITGLQQTLDGKASTSGVGGSWACNSLTVASAIVGGSYIAAGVGYRCPSAQPQWLAESHRTNRHRSV